MVANPIKEKSFGFAIRIIKLAQWLKKRSHFELAQQIIRAGTSIGANVEEALAGQSRKDFVSKMAIASKEARETNYWLRLLMDSGILSSKMCTSLLTESEELIKMLTSIVKTSQSIKTTKNSKLKIKN
ncbi:MAG: four helix bundle protein [Planctomycetes bacterium]|nr:four helix bundle protein [Planctomycetota bacterium]MBU1518605.1 four helix bundle protein [Planctomycetota bacterium]MBU2458539.1 four helix bundle protein [Planctomycetota bacterium]MBU2597323.1 four helix bundle protein [Planctomycetota bacterium]